ncbi:MAG TPA: YceI family protein [Acidimicrobiales bacterium]|nr:YceI family protein [Acidimicrobiales bacterium]
MTDPLQDRPPARDRGGRRVAIGAGVAAILVATAVIGYLLFFRGSSEERLSLDPAEETAPSAAPVTPATAAGRWVTTAGSEAGYRVREKLSRLPAQSDAVGRTTAVSGAMTVATEGDRLVARDLRVEVDVSRLRSDESRRDNRIRSDGLETDRFPTATFVSTGDVVVPPDATSGRAFTAEVTGDLTLHGVTRRVTIPVEGRVDAGSLQVVGSYNFPMSQFDIDPPNVGGFVTVDPDATLEFKVVMAKS